MLEKQKVLSKVNARRRQNFKTLINTSDHSETETMHG